MNNLQARQPPSIPALTGLRFVAAIGVVAFHYDRLLSYPWLGHQIALHSWIENPVRRLLRKRIAPTALPDTGLK